MKSCCLYIYIHSSISIYVHKYRPYYTVLLIKSIKRDVRRSIKTNDRYSPVSLMRVPWNIQIDGQEVVYNNIDNYIRNVCMRILMYCNKGTFVRCTVRVCELCIRFEFVCVYKLLLKFSIFICKLFAKCAHKNVYICQNRVSVALKDRRISSSNSSSRKSFWPTKSAKHCGD